jgi:hypothetical protein
MRKKLIIGSIIGLLALVGATVTLAAIVIVEEDGFHGEHSG